MNSPATAKRPQMLGMLVEGMSMRAVTRLTGVSIYTVSKLLTDPGKACAACHDENVRGVATGRIQADEIWSSVYAKQKNLGKAKDAPEGAGDPWTWTALDADSKLIVSWVVGNRNVTTALYLMDGVQQRLTHWVQRTTDGHRAYLDAVEATCAPEIDYAMLVKLSGGTQGQAETRYSPAECIGTRKRVIQGDPDPAKMSTFYVGRQNLSMRMGMRRFTRLTNAFFKRIEKHMLALYLLDYNFCRVHKTLRCTSAMEAALDTTVRSLEWIAGLIDARALKPNRPVTYRSAGRLQTETLSDWWTT